MSSIQLYSQELVLQLTRIRENETKVGEEIKTLTDVAHWEKELSQLTCKFVLIGIPEDIGVRANYGRGGAHTAWKPALESFLNQQSNLFFDAKTCCVLGHIVVDDLMQQADELSAQSNNNTITGLRKLVDELDARVATVIGKIVMAGKIPLVIGGGHNNSFPIIKGISEALGQKTHSINCDPHSDFRALEGRHSGNGFSYAFEQNYLNKYAVFCLHEQYNTKTVLHDFLKQPQRLYYNTYENIFVREKLTYSTALQQAIAFVKDSICGVELDMDAITNVPSSAKTSSGLSPIQARQYVYACGNQLNTTYLHIAEGAPILSHIKADNKTGKLIAYLITDFIKGVLDKNE